jgi:hypothetical protein
MTKKPAVHTVPVAGGGWTNKREGASRGDKKFETKVMAQAAGRIAAKNDKTEHIIHNKDGEIASRNSYGNDPFPPKG